MMKKLKYLLFLLIHCSFLLIPITLSGQNSPEAVSEEAVNMITQIYKTVSANSGKEVDWEKLRSFFIEDAVIIIRTSPEGSTKFNVDEFIQDFKDFYNNPLVSESGFKEEVLRVNAQLYGDAAAIGVVYQASITGSERPPQKGVDFWLLTRREQGWKVLGVSNETIAPGEAVPDMFEKH